MAVFSGPALQMRREVGCEDVCGISSMVYTQITPLMLTGVDRRIGRICSMHSPAFFVVVFSPRAVSLLSPATGLALQALLPQVQAQPPLVSEWLEAPGLKIYCCRDCCALLLSVPR